MKNDEKNKNRIVEWFKEVLPPADNVKIRTVRRQDRIKYVVDVTPLASIEYLKVDFVVSEEKE